MTPLTVTRCQSGPLSWVSPDDLKEWAYRAKLFERGREGHEDSLAEIRDGLGIRTWIHMGKTLIREGVLVGVKP